MKELFDEVMNEDVEISQEDITFSLEEVEALAISIESITHEIAECIAVEALTEYYIESEEEITLEALFLELHESSDGAIPIMTMEGVDETVVVNKKKLEYLNKEAAEKRKAAEGTFKKRIKGMAKSFANFFKGDRAMLQKVLTRMETTELKSFEIEMKTKHVPFNYNEKGQLTYMEDMAKFPAADFKGMIGALVTNPYLGDIAQSMQKLITTGDGLEEGHNFSQLLTVAMTNTKGHNFLDGKISADFPFDVATIGGSCIIYNNTTMTPTLPVIPKHKGMVKVKGAVADLEEVVRLMMGVGDFLNGPDTYNQLHANIANDAGAVVLDAVKSVFKKKTNFNRKHLLKLPFIWSGIINKSINNSVDAAIRANVTISTFTNLIKQLDKEL